MGGVNNQNRRGVYCYAIFGFTRRVASQEFDTAWCEWIVLYRTRNCLLNKGSIDGRQNFRLRNGGDSLSGRVVESISFDLPLHKISFFSGKLNATTSIMDPYVYFTLSFPYYIHFRLYLVSSDLSRDPVAHFCLALAFLKNDSMNKDRNFTICQKWPSNYRVKI